MRFRFRRQPNLTNWRRGDAAGTRQPRILFLADRNILAEAFNTFVAFPDDAMVGIDPDTVRKKGRVPKNGSIFFTIFQTSMTGTDADGESQPNFGDYPSDFLDLTLIDECHRGGAHDESTWRANLDYFSPAVQIGLTATPKRKNNADTYGRLLEKGYTKQQLGDVSRMIRADDSDLFDVLSYIAFATPPVSRAERVQLHQPLIASTYDGAQREFIDFVLSHYIQHGNL